MDNTTEAESLVKSERFVSPASGLSMCERSLLFFPAPDGTTLVGIAATKGSISQGETLSGLGMDAGSSHWTWEHEKKKGFSFSSSESHKFGKSRQPTKLLNL